MHPITLTWIQYLGLAESVFFRMISRGGKAITCFHSLLHWLTTFLFWNFGLSDLKASDFCICTLAWVLNQTETPFIWCFAFSRDNGTYYGNSPITGSQLSLSLDKQTYLLKAFPVRHFLQTSNHFYNSHCDLGRKYCAPGNLWRIRAEPMTAQLCLRYSCKR